MRVTPRVMCESETANGALGRRFGSTPAFPLSRPSSTTSPARLKGLVCMQVVMYTQLTLVGLD